MGPRFDNQQRVVGRRVWGRGCQPVHLAALHQLQSAGQQVSDDVPAHRRELGGKQRQNVDSPARRRFGKIFRIGKQPVSAQVQGFYNVEKPEFGAEWTLRAQLRFLFPKSKRRRFLRGTAILGGGLSEIAGIVRIDSREWKHR